MKILTLDKSNKDEIVNEAVNVLQNGGVVIYPTETCYGIGVDATNEIAVEKLLKYKAKRQGKPFSIAVSGIEMAQKYVDINEIAENLYKNFLPGPLTVISKSLKKVASKVESEHGTLGVRVPDHPLVLWLIDEFGKPITATSANASYKKVPYKIQDILENISKKQKKLVDLIIDAGELPPRPSSTVVDTTMNESKVLRQGNIKLTKTEIRKSTSAKKTRDIGEELINKFKQYLGYKSIIIAMQGELGAGKTEMTKGIARGLGIEDEISSPTFIIENVIRIPAESGSFQEQKKVELFHIDTWRLYEPQELLDLEFQKQVDDCNVFVIEWAEKVVDILKSVSSDSIIQWVKIEYGKDETERIIEISDFGEE